MSSSRRERRFFAKKMGFLSRKENFQEMSERLRRSNQAGQHLHTHHLQEIKNSEVEIQKFSDSTEEEYMDPYEFLQKNKETKNLSGKI